MDTDTRLGQFLSITGVVHLTRGCATRGRNKGVLITTDDVAYWTANGTTHDECERCHR